MNASDFDFRRRAGMDYGVRRAAPLWIALALLLSASRAPAGEEATPFCRIFDTGSSSDTAPSAEAVGKKAGWRLVPENNVAHQFAGDAVLANDRLTIVVPRKARGIEVYSATANGLRQRATLGHLGMYSSALVDAPEAVKIVENTASAVMVEAIYKTGPQASLRLRLTTGEGILEIRPSEGAYSVDVLTKTQCVIVPDFFADDMIFVPEKFRGVGLPAENFFLALIEGGDAMLMAVWQSSQQDVHLGTAGVGADAKLCYTRITCAKSKSLWLAFLEHPGIWAHNATITAQWKPPFPAKWRRTVGRVGGLAQSWDPERDKPLLIGAFAGPGVTYPIDRTKATPLTIYTPMDVLRNTLGVGPCQYILQTEGLASDANPTPAEVMTWVEAQFRRKKDKASADEIRERLKQMAEHMGKVRSRIEKYSFTAFETLELCRSDKWPKPLPPVADDLAIALDYLKRFPMGDLERTGPAARPAELASQVAALIGKENALAECERLGAELRDIGGKLDGILSRCRMRTRWLRQRCRMAAGNEPQTAELAKMIQERAERMLQSK